MVHLDDVYTKVYRPGYVSDRNSIYGMAMAVALILQAGGSEQYRFDRANEQLQLLCTQPTTFPECRNFNSELEMGVATADLFPSRQLKYSVDQASKSIYLSKEDLSSGSNFTTTVYSVSLLNYETDSVNIYT